ncbi:MAG: ABC transporter substrate-binding protein [Jatrophihabitans sp.]
MITPRWLLAPLAAAVLALAACSSPGGGGAASRLDASDWNAVLAAAKGQTVNWYMYGGDDTLNSFVNGYLSEQLKRDGVSLHQVKVADTGDAVNTVLGQKQAGKASGGAVDAIWINGENFATGVQAKLWYCGWVRDLPNSKYVDPTDPAVTSDFGVPVNGCESGWQQADSALVYNSADLTKADVASVSSLFSWAGAHPGKFNYPALPDFTGSIAVRTILYDTIGGPRGLSGAFDETKYAAAAKALFARLNAIAPALWRGGNTYPQSEDAVEKLYTDGVISVYFTYGPGAVGDLVKKGQYPASTREAVLSVGNIGNVSNLAIPADAAHRAGALVLANLLQDPATQLALYRAEGSYPGIDLDRTSTATQRAFAAVPLSPSVLPLATLLGNAQPELASAYVTRIEKDWKSDVLQK